MVDHLQQRRPRMLGKTQIARVHIKLAQFYLGSGVQESTFYPGCQKILLHNQVEIISKMRKKQEEVKEIQF